MDEAEDKASTFGKLLLRHRRAAELTQADLAEASGVSVRALRDLERGRAQAAQRRSAVALADAMDLDGAERELFLGTAKEGRRRVAKPPEPEPEAGMLCPMPPPVADLLGREPELAKLRELATAGGPGGVVVSIVGHPGVGKTALAVSAAHALRRDFPDGCLAVDLRGMDDQPVTPRSALDQLVRALGVPAHRIPAAEREQSNLFRSLLAGRRVLVLLDNARDEAQVRPLLATSPGCLTVVTCRRALAGLEAARWVWLEPLADSGAVDLLAAIVGVDRVRAEPAAAAELVALCGNLPLAVRIAGNRLASRPHWSIAYLATQLSSERTRLSSLSAGDLQVRSAFEMSYHRLSPAARLVFRRLAVLPGANYGAELAAVAAGTSAPDVQTYVEELVDANLLQAAATPGRYQFHDLIRIFAGERLEAEESTEERQRLADAVLEHLLRTATAAGLLFYPDRLAESARGFRSREEAAAWLEQEGSNWLAAQREAARLGRHREVLDLAKAMHWYSDGRTHQRPWEAIFALGVDAARKLGSRREEAVLLNFLGWARYFCLGENEAGLAAHREALAAAIDAGDRREQTWAQAYIGSVMMRLGHAHEALDHVERAVASCEELSFWMGQGSIRNVLGATLRTLGRLEDALAVHREVLADVEKHRDEANIEARRLFTSVTLLHIGLVQLNQRTWLEAAKTFQEARGLFDEGGFQLESADAAFHEGKARLEAGELKAAKQCLRRALSGFTEVTSRWQRAQTLGELTTVLTRLGESSAADEYRREAVALCVELGTDEAAALSRELAEDGAA